MSSRTILITGCSSGIGRCAAETLRQRGYRVFASARRREDVTALAQAGFEALLLDLSDSDSIQEALAQLFQSTGNRLDALFNNGAYGQPGALEDLPRAALREQFETNLFGLHELTRSVIPVMRARGAGRIIQNSSVLGFVALRYRGAYIASKFALEGWSDTLRLELRGSGIHIALIEPGPVATNFRQNGCTAFRRWINPEQSIHRDEYQTVLQRVCERTEQTAFTVPPEVVVKKVIHALESPRPKLRYRVTFPTHFFALLKRILPARLMDSLLIAH